MNYLIKGGEFNNKGAEAMTLIALEKIARCDEKAKIYIYDFGFNVPFDFNCDVTFVQFPSYFTYKELKEFKDFTVRERITDIVKFFVPGKKSFLGKNKKLREIIKSIDIVIDISGFALSSKWGERQCLDYISWIDLMSKYGARIYLMSQSFGPFSFDQTMMRKIKDSLSKCELILAREESGEKCLCEMGLTNVKKSYDTVLVEKGNEYLKVIKDYESFQETFDINLKTDIGIIPNSMLFEMKKVDPNELYGIYQRIIDKLLAANNRVFLIAHAGGDLNICRTLKKNYLNESNVILIDHVMYSFNFEEMTKNFKFIIASRYHSIVHAYKEGTPAVIIGWSDKYDSLARIFDQTQYIVDTDRLENCINAVDTMKECNDDERMKIKKTLNGIQGINYYDFL